MHGAGGSKRRNRRMDNRQLTEKEQQRAKEAEETLRIAIKEEQADIQNKNTKEEEAIEERQGKKRAELGIRMLQELERHIEGGKRRSRY